MRPRERRETGQGDLLRSRLDAIIDMGHALVKLAGAIDWRFLEERFGAIYTDGPGQPPLPTRLMAGLAILKHMHNLSDETLCERWVENPYYQYFCGEEFFQHRLIFDRSSLTRWRQRMGEEKLQALLQESLATATRTQAMKPSDLSRVIVDTDGTAQERDVPDRRQALEPGPRGAGPAREETRCRASPILCAGGQDRAHQAAALLPMPNSSSAHGGA
jgi:transposase, IS5 family